MNKHITHETHGPDQVLVGDAAMGQVVGWQAQTIRNRRRLRLPLPPSHQLPGSSRRVYILAEVVAWLRAQPDFHDLDVTPARTGRRGRKSKAQLRRERMVGNGA